MAAVISQLDANCIRAAHTCIFDTQVSAVSHWSERDRERDEGITCVTRPALSLRIRLERLKVEKYSRSRRKIKKKKKKKDFVGEKG